MPASCDLVLRMTTGRDLWLRSQRFSPPSRQMPTSCAGKCPDRATRQRLGGGWRLASCAVQTGIRPLAWTTCGPQSLGTGASGHHLIRRDLCDHVDLADLKRSMNTKEFLCAPVLSKELLDLFNILNIVHGNVGPTTNEAAR
jgi:hypothetical protein